MLPDLKTILVKMGEVLISEILDAASEVQMSAELIVMLDTRALNRGSQICAASSWCHMRGLQSQHNCASVILAAI